MSDIRGIHHVTAIAGNPQENLDFYAGVLGMRLVKKSVNQDDPGTYHLFYADGEGRPGSDLTFFPWTQLAPSRKGVGLTVEVPLAVAPGSLGYWEERLSRYGASVGTPETRFGEKTLAFRDPHGLELALVETDHPREWSAWDESPVPAERQVRRIHAVRMWQRDLQATEAFVTGVLGFKKLGTEATWHRYGVAGGGSGALLEIRELPEAQRGQWGTGSVHHVAWALPDDETQLALRAEVEAAGRRPTELIDRFWFKSVYFMEPGGALFELATLGPGFAVDEHPDQLGERLILPPWLEQARPQIEGVLPALGAPSPHEVARDAR
ncbi:MAG TPA: ring-cleaving dioxygenase [Trueperaceae bacterium]